MKRIWNMESTVSKEILIYDNNTVEIYYHQFLNARLALILSLIEADLRVCMLSCDMIEKVECVDRIKKDFRHQSRA